MLYSAVGAAWTIGQNAQCRNAARALILRPQLLGSTLVSMMNRLRILTLLPLFLALAACDMVVLNPSGDVAAPAARSAGDVDVADAAHHRSCDGAHSHFCLALSAQQSRSALRAGLASLHAPGAGHLVGAAADHHLSRRADLARHASARPVSSARSPGARPGSAGGRQGAAGQRGRARLEVAVHLSRATALPPSTSWRCR